MCFELVLTEHFQAMPLAELIARQRSAGYGGRS